MTSMIEWEGMLINPNDVQLLKKKTAPAYRMDDEEDEEPEETEEITICIYLRGQKLPVTVDCKPVMFEMLKTMVIRGVKS